ncbi:GxxExxY protein [Thermoleptolyngbya sichuanensis XZ-Cy5]|nr:GxxExxY protein [Thermoleptolyngbya sichuanensis XZ-Cy5]
MNHGGTEGMEMELDEISGQVIGAAIAVHRELGPGLLESAYEACLVHELRQRGVQIEQQIPQPVIYKGLQLECGYRLDLLVENRVIVELKAVETLLPIHEAQLLTYLKLRQLRLGLLINFNVPILKRGIKRLLNG